MNRAPFEAFVVDNPRLFDVLSAPALMESASTTAEALAILQGVRPSVEESLQTIRTTLRQVQPPLDKDIVVRMEAALSDSLI
jgi:hypothetical protein